MNKYLTTGLLVIILILSGMCIANNSNKEYTKIDVIKVYDGDSISAKIEDNFFRIRLIGIDCFEGTKSNHAKRQAKEFKISEDDVVKGGNIAKDELADLLKNKNVTFEFRGIDKYNRALGILYVGNINVNDYMLNSPYCNVYKYNKKPLNY